MLRDYFPGSAEVLLVLLVIATYMNRDGMAFPGQTLIAKGARCGVRTVKRRIAAARELGWLGVGLAGRVGQGWRHNAYQAVVPEDLPLDEQDDALADAVAAQVGQLDERGDTAMAPPSREQPERGDSTGPNVGPESDRRGANPGQTWGHLGGPVTPALRTPALGTHASEARLAPSARVQEHENERPEPRADSPAERVAKLTAEKNLKAVEAGSLARKDDKTDRWRRIRTLAASQSPVDLDLLAKTFRTSEADVMDALRETA